MIHEALRNIQEKLKAPKGQTNSYGNYKYRSCEDILEAVKPLLTENKCTLTLADEIIHTGDRYYVKATATLTSEDGTSVSNTAYAREAESRKGMDDSQITGTASSYARKYALNGLFCIDDTKDADTDEYAKKTGAQPRKASPKQIELIQKLVQDIPKMLEWAEVTKIEDLSMEQASEIISKKKGGK